MLAACVQKSVSHRATHHTRPLCGTQIPPSQVFVSNRVCCLCTEYRCQCTVVAVRCRGATWCGILTDEVRNYPRAGCRVQDTGYGTNVLFPSCSPLNAIRLQFLIKTWSFWQKKHFCLETCVRVRVALWEVLCTIDFSFMSIHGHRQSHYTPPVTHSHTQSRQNLTGI